MTTENKYKKWIFTLEETNLDYIPESSMLEHCLRDLTETYGFQLEQASRKHFQGFFVLAIRKRKQTILNEIKEWFTTNDPLFDINHLTINQMLGTVEQAEAYSSKNETKIGDYVSNKYKYSQSDIKVLENKKNRFPWQQSFFNIFFNETESNLKDPDDRTIHIFVDEKGKSGKSKLIKYLCVHNQDVIKMSFGSASQLRSSVATSKVFRMYIIDIPRTLGDDDSMRSLMSTIEDIKNGFVVSTMYGEMKKLIFEPPHIVIMTNKNIDLKFLSDDRWVEYTIINKELYSYDPDRLVLQKC